MKKGWKIFWIVCACLAGLGLVLCISGFVMGATFAGIEHMFWKNAEDEAVWESDFSGNASTVTGNVKASLTGIGELDVDVSYLQVEIQESANDEIVFLTNNIPAEVEDELMLVQDGDELEVYIRNEKKWRRVMNSRGELATLTIQIPKKHSLRSMALYIGAGILEADDIRVSELEIGVGAGEANIHQFTVNSLEVNVGAGEADLTGTAVEEAAIECGIGKVNYQAIGSQEEYSYDVEVGAGVVSIGDEDYSGLMNNKKIMNGGPLMEIECGIGEVNVTFDE